MAIKVYVSGISGSHEVRKQQQRVLFILQSLPIDLKVIDVTDPGKEEDLTFMQEEVKKHDKKTQLPPQIFNDNAYCGDYTDFALANDDDEIMRFLKLEDGPSKLEKLKNPELEKAVTQNGINHESNEEELGKTEEPTSNGIEDPTEISKETESYPTATEHETNETSEDADKPSEEIVQADATVKDDDEKKETTEESEEEEESE